MSETSTDSDSATEMQIIDVHLPSIDDRTIILSRHTQPEADLQLLLKQLNAFSFSFAV